MTLDRIKLCAIAAALATTLTGEVSGQSAGAAPGGVSAPVSGTSTAPAGVAAPAPAKATTPSPARVAPPAPAGVTPAPASANGRPQGNATAQPGTTNASTSTNATTTGTGVTGAGITGGVPAMNGVVPNRAELASSAFTKLDAGKRGYVSLDDVRQLDGLESAFRQADQNADGRLNASEFNSAWGVYTGNVR